MSGVAPGFSSPSPAAMRSASSQQFTRAAAAGRLELQRCKECETYCYPARDACPSCWADALVWTEAPAGGVLLSTTVLHHSFDPYFRARLPWRIGTVLLDAGPVVLAHVCGAASDQDRVRVLARTDASSNGVLIAVPEQAEFELQHDVQSRSLSCDPEGREVLIVKQAGAKQDSLVMALHAVLQDAGAVRVRTDDSAALLALEQSSAASGSSFPYRPDFVIWLTPRPSATQHRPGSPGSAGSQTDPGRSPGRNVGRKVGRKVGPGFDASRGLNPGPNPDSEDSVLSELLDILAPALTRQASERTDGMGAWINLYYAAATGSIPDGPGPESIARRRFSGRGVKVIDFITGPDSFNSTASEPSAIQANQVAQSVLQAMREGIEWVRP